jgi:hypothetical protein
MAEGIDVRVGGDGRKSYRVRVWSQRVRKRIVKTFSSLAEAKAWRADALVALRGGTLRAPDPRTVREAAEAPVRGWLEASALVDAIDADACLLARDHIRASMFPGALGLAGAGALLSAWLSRQLDPAPHPLSGQPGL